MRAPAPFSDAPAGGVTGLMLRLLAAMVPGLAALAWWFGPGVLIHLAIASASALAWEALAARLRGRPAPLADGSALVTAWLLAASLPPLAPWWVTVTGTGFAILVAKQLYGGLGQNPFNPAMVGYVVLLVSFPREMTSWVLPRGLVDPPGLAASLSAILGMAGPPDGHTGATALDLLRTARVQGAPIASVAGDPRLGTVGGTGWEWVNLGFLAGGLWLVARRIAAWQIPAAMLAALAIAAALGHALDPGACAPASMHLASGATMLGAFFIATDPVTAATSDRGRLVYGAGIGLITYLIRAAGGYPDGVVFGVLLMNLCVPIIDRCTRPRVFGAG